MGCSQTFTVYIEDLQKNLLLIRLVNMGFNGMFSDLHCIYRGLTEESAFNQIGEHWFQWDVLRCSLYIAGLIEEPVLVNRFQQNVFRSSLLVCRAYKLTRFKSHLVDMYSKDQSDDPSHC